MSESAPAAPLLRIIPLRPAGSLRLIERHARAYRHMWLVFASGIAEPLFYLLSIGVGLGVMIGKVPGPGGHLVPYREFVAPGLLAVSAMNGAMYDSTFNIFFRLKYEKLYDAVLSTPIGPFELALGEIGWALIRGVIYAVAFTLVMLVMGLVSSWWAIFAVPVAVLTGFAFAAVGMAGTTFMKSWQDFDYVILVSMPLFLFSTTFYPLSVYPRPVAVIVEWSPLYQGVTLLRDLVLGDPGPDLAWRAAYLLAMGVAGLLLAARRIGKLLLVLCRVAPGQGIVAEVPGYPGLRKPLAAGELFDGVRDPAAEAGARAGSISMTGFSRSSTWRI